MGYVKNKTYIYHPKSLLFCVFLGSFPVLVPTAPTIFLKHATKDKELCQGIGGVTFINSLCGPMWLPTSKLPALTRSTNTFFCIELSYVQYLNTNSNMWSNPCFSRSTSNHESQISKLLHVSQENAKRKHLGSKSECMMTEAWEWLQNWGKRETEEETKSESCLSLFGGNANFLDLYKGYC